MFRPRHAYKSPITNRYRGKPKGCPVFNNLNEITSSMVEQHDECLECLANIKNRSDLYRTLADNNKPNNHVIKSLQRLSSSASNNRLKTCLQFLIIRVNEKSIIEKQSKIEKLKDVEPPRTLNNNITRIKESLRSTSHRSSPELGSTKEQSHTLPDDNSPVAIVSQVFSPIQDQVSSTQDQIIPQPHDDEAINEVTVDIKEIPPAQIEMNTLSDHEQSPIKRRKMSPDNLVEQDDDFSSSCSSSSYESAHSPSSSSSSISSDSSDDSMSSSNSSSYCSSASSCSSIIQRSPVALLETDSELRGPRLKLSDDKIRKIRKRPISFDDNYLDRSSFASTPTTSSECSPGQNGDMLRFALGLTKPVIHSFQAPPQFVNNLKPCNLPIKNQETPTPPCTQPVTTKEMVNCAICGIKEKPSNISRIYGQNSCPLCTRFFSTFLKRPQQLYCAQDGDCLMTFDSRCQACWIKICLQKFHVEEENRKIGQKFSPKLLSSPNVSLITIDTSLPRH